MSDTLDALAEHRPVQVWHHSLSYWVPWSPACGAEHRKGVDFQTFDPLAVTCPACATTPWVAEQKAKAARGADPHPSRGRRRGR